MTYLKEKPEAVCRECESLSPHAIMLNVPAAHWECRTPDLATDKGWCPVTGREQTNYPLCRVVNADGNCPHYEPREKA